MIAGLCTGHLGARGVLDKRTELTSRAMEMVCWARVILFAVNGALWNELLVDRVEGLGLNGCLWKEKWAEERSDANEVVFVGGDMRWLAESGRTQDEGRF